MPVRQRIYIILVTLQTNKPMHIEMRQFPPVMLVTFALIIRGYQRLLDEPML